VVAKALACVHCQAALTDAEQVLHDRYDKVDLPPVRPVVTRVERYVGRCLCCGGVTLAAVPDGMEPGTPFRMNILALAIYLRFTHAISYLRLSRLFQALFALQVSEGALDAMFHRAKPCFDNEVAAILARLRRSRIICSDETNVRIDGRIHWNWVFQNETVVIHVIRNSRAAGVVADVLNGHRPSTWVSDLYSAQQGHADLWQICLAHQLRDCQYAIEAGDTIFARRAMDHEPSSISPCSAARNASFCAASVRSRTAHQRTTISATSWRCSTPSSSSAALSPGSLH
jgi:transposase